MPDNDRQKIEDVKRHLYDPDGNITRRPHEGVLHPIEHQVASTWKPEKDPENEALLNVMKKPPTSIFKKFFLGAVVFFLCAVAFSVYMFYGNNQSVSNDKIDIAVLGNAFTKGGDDLPLQVEITNRNNSNLELANLIV